MGSGGGDSIALGRHRGKFCAVIGRGRQRNRVSLGTADPILARARFAEFVQSRERLDRPQRPSLGAIMDAYLSDRQGEVADPARIKFAIAKLRPVFGDLLASHIDRKICKSYVAKRQEAGAGIGTAHTELAALRAALNWAHRQQPPWIDHAPFIWMPPKPEPQSRYLTRPEADRLLAECKAPHLRLFVLLALHTAGRVTAILDLTWARVDMDRRIITLRDPEKGKTAKGRATVPVNETLFQALLAAQEGAISEAVVEMAGHRIFSVKHGLAEAARRAKLRGVSPHVLRHTAAVWMAEARIPMAEIAAFLGHTDSRITERVYAKFSPEHLRHAARALG